MMKYFSASNNIEQKHGRLRSMFDFWGIYKEKKCATYFHTAVKLKI